MRWVTTQAFKKSKILAIKDWAEIQTDEIKTGKARVPIDFGFFFDNPRERFG